MLSRIIIIEDEFFVQIHLTKILTNLGYQVVNSYHCTEDFLEETDWNFDIALVDIFLSETLTGIDAAKEIKQKQKPFIFLTANQDSTTILEAAQLGPSAYLTKPFQAEELLARLNALIRRSAGQASPLIKNGPLSINTKSLQVEVNNKAIKLSSSEYKLLEYMMLHLDEVTSKATLTEHIYDQDFDLDSNVIEVFIRQYIDISM